MDSRISRAEFLIKILHYVSRKTVSRNLTVLRNLPYRNKKCNWPKRLKNKFHLAFFKNKNKPKELKKSHKLHIWPHKSKTAKAQYQKLNASCSFFRHKAHRIIKHIKWSRTYINKTV